MRPLIGVTTSEMRMPRRTLPLPEGDPPQSEMALGIVYARAVEEAGGLPVVLPPLEQAAIPALVDRLAGICLSGGPDLDPAAYEADPDPHLGPVEPDLDAFELAVARRADELGIPMLGICRGCQAMNVARGGTLHQHLPDVTALDHLQDHEPFVPAHPVVVAPGSLLHRVAGATGLPVNSFHHQAAATIGDGLAVCAQAPDGTVEALWDPAARFCVGVQWHAELLTHDPRHAALLDGLVHAARGATRRLALAA